MLAEEKLTIDNIELVGRLSKALDRLAVGGIDVVLLDLGLPDSQGLNTFEKIHSAAKQLPILILTGFSDDAFALEAVRRGAQDYLIKGKLNGWWLFRAITYAIERKKAGEQIKQLQEFLQLQVDRMPIGLIVWDTEFRVKTWNPSATRIFGFAKQEAFGKHPYELIVPKQTQLQTDKILSRLLKGDLTANSVNENLTKDGRTISCDWSNTPLKKEDGTLIGVLSMVQDITEGKKTQHALEESEEKFRTITNSIRDAIITVDNESKIVSWNPTAEKTFGYSRIEAIGKKIHELVVPNAMSVESKEYIRIGVQQFAKTGKDAFTNGNVELVGRRKDGTEFPVEVSLTSIKLQGKWSAVGVVKDITERKQAEQNLREAEKRYHALFNEAPLGVLVIDPQTAKPVEFNDVANTQLGYSREEFSKLCIQDFEAKEKADETKAHVAKMVQEGGDQYETKHRCKDGEIRNVLVTTKAIDLAGKPFLYCVFHDITEIRKVQDALMESETKYRQLVNVAQEGIWAFDNNYHTVFVNPQMAQMLRCSESELVGKSIFEFLDKKDLEQAKQFLGQFNHGFKGHFDYTFTRKDGSRIYASFSASVINDDEGTPVGTLAMVSDITDRKILERKVNNYSKHLKSMIELRTVQLKYANEQLVKSERLAAIGELAGMVGHDLRNPLAGIKNAAYFLRKKGTSISEVQSKEMLDIIEKAIAHSDKIINELLDYAREIHLELTEYGAPALLDDALRMIQVPDRIQIVRRIAGETQIKVDTDKMMRVFINLIKNALDAMPGTGTLEISSRQTGNNVEISFADTGTGIPKETLQKIFTPLFTTKAQGMGFGLAICKRIIDAHGGSIKVNTEVNRGTTFTVTLPVKPKGKVGGEKTWINVPESLLLTTTKT